MTANGWFQICIFFLLILVCAKPLGTYMARVFERQRTFADPVFRPIERLIYRLTGIDENHEMRWTEYALAHAALQPGHDARDLRDRAPAAVPAAESAAPRRLWRPTSRSNTAASFTTNTNWQAYVARDDDELPHADGHPRLSQLLLRRRRHRARHRVHPRHLTPRIEDARQLLGRYHSRLALGSAAHLLHLRAAAGLAGSHPELSPL